MARIKAKRKAVAIGPRLVRATYLLQILSLLGLSAGLQAQFAFTTNNGTITITDYTNSLPNVLTIPASITVNGIDLPVTGIAPYAFSSFNHDLINVTIPESIVSIGDYAFRGCFSLMAITVDTNNSVYSSLNGVLFNKSRTKVIRYPGGKSGAYTIPNTVTSIGPAAFNLCTNLTNVTIPNSVIEIEHSAFAGCYSLSSIAIPGSVASIGDWVFNGCKSLSSVKIPNGVTNIGSYTFIDCRNLESVAIGNGVISIGDMGFYYCTNLTSIYFRGNAPSLGGIVFGNDNKAIIYYLPGTTGWGSSFGGLPAVRAYTSVTNNNTITLSEYAGPGGDEMIPGTINDLPVTSIGDMTFHGCTRLHSVIIPDGVAHIGNAAFYECSYLTNTVIPDSVSYIGNYAFCGCYSLPRITIGNHVISIGDLAFYYCTNLTSVYFRSNAPNIGSSVFYNDNKATAYYLPGTFGWSAFIVNAGIPIALWLPQVQTSDANFGVRTNLFGFNINWADGKVVVIEACTDLANSIWIPTGTNILIGGSSYFSDPQWTNYAAHFYRLSWP